MGDQVPEGGRVQAPVDGVGFGRHGCSNCGQPLALHCTVHTIPCCPMKCPVPFARPKSVLDEVADERRRQDEKWGPQDCHDFEWVSILTEEVGESAAEANEANFTSGKNRGDWTKLRTVLVQVAAVAVAWIEAIDRRPLHSDGAQA